MPARVVPRTSSNRVEFLHARAGRIASALTKMQVTHAVGIPDNSTRFIFDWLRTKTSIQVVPICREGEAWAIASGLWVGGKIPVVIIQNTGLLESGDAYRGTAAEIGVPLLVIMDYRGYHTLESSKEDGVDSAAIFCEPTLEAWNIPYRFLEENSEAETIEEAIKQAHHVNRPVAVLLT